MKQHRAVSRSIVALRKSLRASVKELNQQAARLVSSGKYEASSAMIESAKKIDEFSKDIDALSDRWILLKRSGGGQVPGEKTPLWEYYVLIARALTELGGEAARRDMIKWIESNAITSMKPGDLGKTPQGRIVWQRLVGRAKRPMVKEGYLESDAGKYWRLTKLGRDLAKRAG